MIVAAIMITVCFVLMDRIVVKSKVERTDWELIGVFSIWWLFLMGSFYCWTNVIMEAHNA